MHSTRFGWTTAGILAAAIVAVATAQENGNVRPDASARNSRQPNAAAPAEAMPQPSEEPVVGQMEHHGWGLIGASGRHYVFGGLAMADYIWQGERRIVTLAQDEPTMLAKPDDNFLYYRELGDGHRWAIGRHPLADDTYVVYFQPQPAAAEGAALPRPQWSVFHRARLIWPQAEGVVGAGDPQISQTTQMRKAPCAKGN